MGSCWGKKNNIGGEKNKKQNSKTLIPCLTLFIFSFASPLAKLTHKRNCIVGPEISLLMALLLFKIELTELMINFKTCNFALFMIRVSISYIRRKSSIARLAFHYLLFMHESNYQSPEVLSYDL